MTRPQKLAACVGSGSACLLLVLSLCFGGSYGVAGSALGLIVSAWTIGSLAILAYALMRDRPQPKQGVVMTALAAILKLPITLFLLYVGVRLPSPGLGCFLGGIGLVYCCTVWFLVGAAHK